MRTAVRPRTSRSSLRTAAFVLTSPRTLQFNGMKGMKGMKREPDGTLIAMLARCGPDPLSRKLLNACA